jgi:putative transposase
MSQGLSPRSITVDHGTEFQSRALEDWAYRRGVQLDFIRPWKPVENAFVESSDGRLRDERLDVHRFASLAEAQTIIETGLTSLRFDRLSDPLLSQGTARVASVPPL